MIKFLINKTKISEAKLSKSISPELTPGEIKIAVSEIAFTANNITYCLLGEKFGYWKFFPARDGYGIIPAWGIGQVISSKHQEVQEGDRLYGYFPMASELVIRPGKISTYGMVDVSDHRIKLPAIYNYYESVANNPILSKNLEHAYMLFNPLFGTSFLLSLFLADENFFDSKSIILTSASSKTALALAYLLKHAANVNVIGITSNKNRDFVEKLDTYNQVITYDEIGLLNEDSSVIVDFAGNKRFLLNLQVKLGDGLKFCSAVGLSHWDKQAGVAEFPLKPSLFFAPSYGAQKIEAWGMKVYKQKLSEVLLPFLEWSMSWIEIANISTDNIPQMYSSSLTGDMDPNQGMIVKF